jgi:two-component system response regulator RegA
MNSRQTEESILIVDDDLVFTSVLAKALSHRGYKTFIANNSEETQKIIKDFQFDKIILDLRIGKDSGISLLPGIIEQQHNSKVVILTGYSSIATAVEAIKLGATNYLCKPADADEILAAFKKEKGDPSVTLTGQPPSVDRIQWEHIQKVLYENDGNISATARKLGMHRRTLQRKLGKKPIQR